jgi:oligosaccharyltransferase complex subunit beta
MHRFGGLFIVVVLFIVGVLSIQESKRTLVILDSSSIKTSHSRFFKSLEQKGYTLAYFTEDDTVAFKTYGEWNYDNLILFAPSTTDLPSGVTAKSILEFIDDGHNVLLVGGTEIGKPFADIASDCNVEFDEEGTFVLDHLNFNSSDFDGSHNVIVADPTNIVDASIIFPKKVDSPILFKGIGQDIEEDSSLLFCVLSASSTAYSHSPDEKIEELSVAGKKICLVSALQARNNARIVFAGSLELFSDSYFSSPVQKYTSEGNGKSSPKSGNEDFTRQLVEWLFQERGILRAIDVQHHRVGETTSPFTYTIKEDIEYSIQIQEWDGKQWIPYLAEDVQLEFRMLDPYVRINLKHNKSGRYTTSFKVPDVYGVFTFKVEYIRRGYGFLTSITRTPVRPFRHNEYERFIQSAFPYYASAFSMMAGLFLFSWFFLYHRDTTKL